MAMLYIVATPIGNLGDMTIRSLETLKTVDLVACEDTRHTLKLLTHFEIRVRLLSCRSGNETSASHKVIAALDEGKTVAYCSDAGTPAISDPGAVLVRNALLAGHTVIPLPGASAFASLVSIAGSTDKSIIFEGFLSHKNGRRQSRLKELLETGFAFVVYESPFRICKLLADLANLENERYVCVGREMTKVHEEYLRGSAAQILSILLERKELHGEFSVFVSGRNT